MSNAAVEAVKQLKCGSSGVKQVLTMLAEAARDEPWKSTAGKVWPPMHAWCSVAYLEHVTEQDRKTVLANLKRAEAKGFIEQVGTDGRTNQVKVFKLNLKLAPVPNPPPVPQLAPVPKAELLSRQTVPFFPSNGPVFPWQRSQKRDTEPY